MGNQNPDETLTFDLQVFTCGMTWHTQHRCAAGICLCKHAHHTRLYRVTAPQSHTCCYSCLVPSSESLHDQSAVFLDKRSCSLLLNRRLCMAQRSRYEQKCQDCGSSEFVDDRAAGDLICQVPIACRNLALPHLSRLS